MLRDTLHTSNAQTGWVMGGIAVLSAVGMLVVGASSDRRAERFFHAAACAVVVSAGCAGAAALSDPTAKMVSLCLAQVAVISFLAPFWVLPTILLSGTSAAVGIALVNAIGFLAPVGYLFRMSFNESTGGGGLISPCCARKVAKRV